jgi:D-tyrosyl-tRNA(Tyr) deacylase|tara:strand:- start:392 stop:841 length:450 start_codon:yes stop_codon:yes gene_type:complete
MRAVVQRVCSASVTVDGRTVGSIERGLLVYVGVGRGDTDADVAYIVDKILHLRLFADGDGKMNLSVNGVSGSVLVVSQFTLFGDCRRGRRPSYVTASDPETARQQYEAVVAQLRRDGLHVETGEFRTMMQINSINDGPITVLLDSSKMF